MSDKILIFDTFYDTYKSMGLPTDSILDSDNFTINNLKHLHPTLPFKSNGFRPNYFSFLFVKDARGKYTTDDVSFATQPGTIYFTNPGHYKSFEWFEIEDVCLITFTETFLRENVHPDIFNEFPFLLSETIYPRTLPAHDFIEFEEIYLQIEKEFCSASKFKNKILGSLLVVLLLKVKESFWKEYNPIYEGNKSSQIVKTFKTNLEQHFRELVEGKVTKQLRVSDYAALQMLNESYLNNVIKSKTGKTVSTWISDKMIAQAKALLHNSALSIKEITFQLGFLETTHFSNYFKKYTQTTPASYRKSMI
ncbi:AraC-like DNA-binding protein [Arcicella aurantiaca]|uniref:AraC-like DNA-binding protein n=1 Tax=Arcicella aurantiaca TaxID=591202 RepID=A0A316DI15_9BACT|nr:AraC family transcriptional regulator [Arcicella aurantiaca]PWK17326.1 AraC-like DNA-binding protein [Arcicella aurantiaca]